MRASCRVVSFLPESSIGLEVIGKYSSLVSILLQLQILSPQVPADNKVVDSVGPNTVSELGPNHVELLERDLVLANHLVLSHRVVIYG